MISYADIEAPLSSSWDPIHASNSTSPLLSSKPRFGASTDFSTESAKRPQTRSISNSARRSISGTGRPPLASIGSAQADSGFIDMIPNTKDVTNNVGSLGDDSQSLSEETNTVDIYEDSPDSSGIASYFSGTKAYTSLPTQPSKTPQTQPRLDFIYSLFNLRYNFKLPNFRLVPNPAISIFLSLVLLTAVVFFSLLIYHKQLLNYLISLKEGLVAGGSVGKLALTCFICVCTFPPFVGYATLLYFSGFVFGFPGGIVPAYFGPFIGGILVFHFGRHVLKPYRTTLISHYPSFPLISHFVSSSSLNLLILFRLAPYPYGLTNLILSATKMTYYQFIVSTAAATLKNILQVYIGATIGDLMSPAPMSFAQGVSLVLGFGSAIGTTAYFTWKVKRLLSEGLSLPISRDGGE